MKKCLIVGDNSNVTGEPARIEQFREYLLEIVGPAATVDTVFFDDIVFYLAKNVFEATAPRKSLEMQDYDVIYLRGNRMQEYFIAKFCASHGIACINDYSMFYPGTKMAQAVVFFEQGVDFLPTYYARDNELLAKYAAQQEGYPFILKTNKGSHGDSNYLINTEEDWHRALKAEPTVDFIAQQYCKNNRDYRLLLVGNEALLFERRAGPKTHLNNTSKGGAATPLPLDTLPLTLIEQARKLAGALGLLIAGVDIIPRLGTNELYFLEVNLQPQLRTGALLQEKQALLKKFLESF
jgi:glutathione synthase/RimK-type ligase-like ATP-grasp enzyme